MHMIALDCRASNWERTEAEDCIVCLVLVVLELGMSMGASQSN